HSRDRCCRSFPSRQWCMALRFSFRAGGRAQIDTQIRTIFGCPWVSLGRRGMYVRLLGLGLAAELSYTELGPLFGLRAMVKSLSYRLTILLQGLLRGSLPVALLAACFISPAPAQR